MNRWQNLLDKYNIVTADGAMGTMLHRAGLQAGELPILWNVDHPDRVGGIHRAYLEAGAQVILTNTFNGNRFLLAKRGLE